MSAKVVNFLAIIVVVYLLALLFMYFNQRGMMYFPATGRPDPATYGAQDVVEIVRVTTEDGLDLQGWYIAPQDQNKPVIVNFHGNAGHYGDRLPKMAGFVREGYGLLLAEYRGYGGNPGKITEQGLYQDARAYLDWLAKKDVETVLYGESLGSGVVVQMATEHMVAAVVLEAPYSTIAEVAQSIYFYMPVKWLMKDQYRSTDKIAAIKASLLIVHGEKDGTIPIRFARKLFQAAVQPKRFVALESAAHNDVYDHGAERHILDFLSGIDFSVTNDAEQKER
ncbi:MAG: alpha/beta hydrolase [Micavibrio sp.]|nr:MAG: alpha/beta hydrolase [Micavibrio sp.]